MKMKFTRFLASSLLILLTTATSVSAQSVGDYQSNGTGGGAWTTAATWQTWNGAAWVAAGASPTSANGVITVLNGDSVALTSAISIDQVVVASGGVLAMGGGGITITLGNTGTNDLDNSGTVRIINGHLDGTGTVFNRAGALLSLQSGGFLGVATNNNGQVQFSANAVVDGTTLTNNNLINWLDGNFYILNGGTFVNADSMAVLPAASVQVLNGASGNFTNAGVVYLKNPALTLDVTNPFTNSGGTVRGFGTVTFDNTVTGNTGTIIPVMTTPPPY
jgi:hypothetical protein